jgi:ribosomal protein S8E
LSFTILSFFQFAIIVGLKQVIFYKMKKTATLLIVISTLLFIVACKKNKPPITIPNPPTITAISPTNGVVNTVVNITGTNFKTIASDNTVKFNGVLAAVNSATATSLNVTAPAGGTTGKVTVTTVDGTGTGPVFTYMVAPPPPTVASISPASGVAGIVVTITGTNFKTTAADNTVTFNGVAATVQTATTTTLNVMVPATGTTGAVTITTVDGSSVGPVFTYLAATDVYVVGKGVSGWGYWKNGVFTAMPANCVEAWCIYVNGTDVYIAGADINTGGPAYWKTGITVDLPMTTGHNGGRAHSVFVVGTDVYAASWDFVNGANSLPRCWKNGVPLNISLSIGNISNGQPVVSGSIYQVVVSGSDIYLAGSQSPFSGNQVATYWKNGVPYPLTDGTSVCEATGIIVSGLDVYVTSNDGTIPKYWKNGVPSVLNTPNKTFSAYPTGIYVSGADVYVSGSYVNTAKYWKNGNMIDLTTTAASSSSEYATGVAGIGTDIYICGNSASSGYGYWKNGIFKALPGSGGIINGIFVQ